MTKVKLEYCINCERDTLQTTHNYFGNEYKYCTHCGKNFARITRTKEVKLRNFNEVCLLGPFVEVE